MEDENSSPSALEVLERENAWRKEEIEELQREIVSLRCEAAELKSEVSAAEGAGTEAAILREVWEDRESTIAFLEREVQALKQTNAESEMRVRGLERKVGVLEVRESHERSKRVRVEEEVRDKEREIQDLKQIIHDLERARVVGVDNDDQLGLGFVWPVVAAGCGVVVAVFYFCFRKRRPNKGNWTLPLPVELHNASLHSLFYYTNPPSHTIHA
ncbi:hypothetical protein Fmac_026931 [Flemingia macrophylla]|uniref:Uncharacterized protein n=1 Tax=Flemingia macrophylla TaxID=520843 RepID=A0ABD1LGA6_9FABA